MTWEERLERAENAGGLFTVEDNDLVVSWTSCAVGEKLDGEDLVWGSAGLDLSQTQELYTLGLSFMHAVESNNVSGARRIFEEIQSLEC